MKSELEDLRSRIDAADDDIVAALNRRFALAAEMRALKRRDALPSVDAAREREIYERVLAATPAAERDVVYGIYEKIFGGSRGVIETIARGVLIQDGKVLLCKAKGSATTYLPGGHIEFGETGEAALAREMVEETGLRVTVGKLLGVVENSFLQHGKRHCEINLVYAMAFEKPERACAAQEAWIEFTWCPVTDLAEYQLLPEDIRKFVK